MSMETSLHDRALERVRGEYLEMPGLRLRPEQVQRLCQIDSLVCRRVLDLLVEMKFLWRAPDGRYVRLWDGEAPRLPVAKATLKPRTGGTSSRRAM